jgi:hypothetical protein
LQGLQKELRGKELHGGEEGEQDEGGGESSALLHCSQSPHCQSTNSFINYLLLLLLNLSTAMISCLHFSFRKLAGWLVGWASLLVKGQGKHGNKAYLPEKFVAA